jgi:hypothetical protein
MGSARRAGRPQACPDAEPVREAEGGLNAADATERGLLGDRAYALMDSTTGKIASAKNPRKWAKLFDLRAAYVECPIGGRQARSGR